MAGALVLTREAMGPAVVNEDFGLNVQLRAGGHVFMPSAPMSRDAEQFPSPDTVDPRRPVESYVHYGAGPQTFLGKDICDVAMVELFRAIFKKKGLRAVPGPQGALKKVVRDDGVVDYLSEDWGTVSPFPVTMKVMWDDK
jgi:linoleate 10R-lipoxygenase